MKFEWDENKSSANKNKHGMDFETATKLWNDKNRIEIQTAFPIEHRSVLIGKIDTYFGRQFSLYVAMLYASYR